MLKQAITMGDGHVDANEKEPVTLPALLYELLSPGRQFIYAQPQSCYFWYSKFRG